jgi:hypothetical protein
MGANYYLCVKKDECMCYIEHIGKGSYLGDGFGFTWHLIEDLDTKERWMDLIDRLKVLDSVKIIDSSGKIYELTEFQQLVNDSSKDDYLDGEFS